MKCFNHLDRDAVGVCKACSKGLCAECAIDLGHGLACNPSHIGEVEQLDSLIKRNARIAGVQKKGSFVSPLFFGFMGIGFLLSGVLTDTRASNFSIAMGVGFVVFGIVSFVFNRKAWNK